MTKVTPIRMNDETWGSKMRWYGQSDLDEVVIYYMFRKRVLIQVLLRKTSWEYYVIN
jgi:hypothetical protein